jgi:hypothetical protein
MEGASDLRLNDELHDFLQLEEILKQISQCDPHCNELQNLERIKIPDARGSHPKVSPNFLFGITTIFLYFLFLRKSACFLFIYNLLL